MLDYETYCKIRDHFDRQGLTITQTARALGLHPQTVSKWVRIEQYRPRRSRPRKKLLDPYKPLIVRWLDAHPLSAQQVFQRLREAGFTGGHTVVGDYVRQIRPRRAQRWLGFFGHGDKWTDCCTFPLWKEQIRCEDRDETIPLRSRPG